LTNDKENKSSFGAYELAGSDDDAQVSIFASGSEVELAMEAKAELDAAGVPTRVVSVPCFELFGAQSEEYRAMTIGTAPVKIGVEAAVRQGWDAFIGSDGVFVGMSSFGASAPYKELYEHFGITTNAIVTAANDRLSALAE
jgi:transketolase